MNCFKDVYFKLLQSAYSQLLLCFPVLLVAVSLKVMYYPQLVEAFEVMILAISVAVKCGWNLSYAKEVTITTVGALHVDTNTVHTLRCKKLYP